MFRCSWNPELLYSIAKIQVLFLIPILLFILQYSSLILEKSNFKKKLLNSNKLCHIQILAVQSHTILLTFFFFFLENTNCSNNIFQRYPTISLNRSFANKFLKVLSSQKSQSPYFNKSIKKCTVKIHTYIYRFYAHVYV